MHCLFRTIEYLNSLGCCFGCKEETNQNEPSERTHLLSGSVNNCSPALRQPDSDDFLDQYPNSLPKKDEQSALTRIVQDTATNIIDVAAMDSHVLEQQEYNDRFNAYQHKINQLWNTVNHPRSEPLGLLKDIPNPHAMLATTPVSMDNLAYVKSTVELVSNAIDEIKVEHKEDLVVPFRIP